VCISPNGRYVGGWYNQCVVGSSRPFVYDTTTTQFMSIPLGPGFTSGGVTDITDEAVMCGTGTHVEAGQRGFVYDMKSGEWTGLPAPHANGWSAARAINSSNVVCGYRTIDDGGDPVHPWTGFTWTSAGGFVDVGLTNNQFTDTFDINDQSVTTGQMMVEGQLHGYITVDGRHLDLGTLAGVETVPGAINNLNQVVGGSRVVIKG
jgi:hypothetical protein